MPRASASSPPPLPDHPFSSLAPWGVVRGVVASVVWQGVPNPPIDALPPRLVAEGRQQRLIGRRLFILIGPRAELPVIGTRSGALLACVASLGEHDLAGESRCARSHLGPDGLPRLLQSGHVAGGDPAQRKVGVNADHVDRIPKRNAFGFAWVCGIQ